LLWRPLGPSRRRRSTGPGARNSTSKLHSIVFPSWSWVGWQTEVDPLSWKCGYDYIKSTRIISWPGSRYDKDLTASSSWKLKPTVRWHVINAAHNTRRPVRDDYKRYQRSCEVPNGWSRYSLPSEGPDEADYVHCSHHGTRFRFPIPLASSTAHVLSTSEDYGYLLFCKTKRSYFRKAELQDGQIVTSLIDEDSKWVGVVRLHVEKAQLGAPESQDTLVELPKQIPDEGK